MRKTCAALLTIGGTLLLAACASSSLPPIDGCTKRPSQEMYQNGMYECPDGTAVFTFATTADRDNWVKTATQFGAEVLGKGATWAKVKEAG